MANGNDLKKAAFGAFLRLKDNLPDNCKLSVENEDRFVIDALGMHGSHLSTHSIDQTHLDPIKLICWIGCAIINGLDQDIAYAQAETILDALINSLEEILSLETNGEVILPKADRILLKRLLMEEIKGNPRHGIGFNGLFIAFHCLRSTYKQIKGE